MLSKRESECLYWASQDKSLKETAKMMFVSTETVKMHRNRIREKYNCKTMLGAYRKYIETDKKGQRYVTR